jgi:hypothetical protein
LLWACWKMKAIASASSRVLMVLSTAPLMGTPEVRLEHGRQHAGGDDGDVSPPMPRRRRAEVSWRQRRSVWAQLCARADQRRIVGIDPGGPPQKAQGVSASKLAGVLPRPASYMFCSVIGSFLTGTQNGGTAVHHDRHCALMRARMPAGTG